MKRFIKISDEDVQNSIQSKKPKNTELSEALWKKTFNEWALVEGIATAENITKEEFQKELPRFILSARTKSGTYYKAGSLSTGVRALVRSLPCFEGQNLKLEDPFFAVAYKALDSHMNFLQKEGFAGQEKSEPFTLDEINKILSLKKFSASTPDGLIRRTFLLIGLHTAERISWHHDLKASDLDDLRETKSGRKYYYLKGKQDKNHHGGLKYKRHFLYIFENPEDPSMCPVHHIREMISLRPPHCSEGSFYLSPNYSKDPTKPKYKNSPVGKNWLSAIVPQACIEAKITGKRTSHSIRATTPTILYHMNIDEQLIGELTNHRSLNGLRSYKRSSAEQHERLRELLTTKEPEAFQSVQTRHVKRRKVDVNGSKEEEEETVETFSQTPPDSSPKEPEKPPVHIYKPKNCTFQFYLNK